MEDVNLSMKDHLADHTIENASKDKDFSRIGVGKVKGHKKKTKIRPDTGGCQPEATPKDIPLRTPEKHEGKVMLVEDVPFNLLAIKNGLNHKNIKYDIAEDGLQAVALFREGSYDVIFMDLNMPNMDGYAATMKIRELEKEKNPKHKVFICGLSAEDDEGTRISYNYRNYKEM